MFFSLLMSWEGVWEDTTGKDTVPRSYPLTVAFIFVFDASRCGLSRAGTLSLLTMQHLPE